MKGIILHGGHGTRLRPLTHTGPKQLLPIANKPMSQYALEDLQKIGIKEIAIILGDVYPEKVKEYYGDGSDFGVNITYIFQDEPKGISHAIKLCKEFVDNSNFVVYLGDNVLRKELHDYATKFESSNSDALILLCAVDEPQRFGVAELNKQGKIKQIIEKPKNPSSNLAVIGIYFLTPKIFDIIDNLKPSWRNELEITDALQNLIDSGNKIEYDIVTGWWKDTGTPEDIIHANQLVLENFFLETNSQKINSKNDKVQLGEKTIVADDAKIIGPVIIGNNCSLGPSVTIGPYVSIGNNSILENCTIKNSIVMNDCKITSKIDIIDSIISNGSVIENEHSSKRKFLLGERSRISL
jgi:glucose-1-phosphate thymidylyltransferase